MSDHSTMRQARSAAERECMPSPECASHLEQTVPFCVRTDTPADPRVAKLPKIAECHENRGRLNGKDAHDAYRILVATDRRAHGQLARTIGRRPGRRCHRPSYDLPGEDVAGGPAALSAAMAGSTETGVGDTETASHSRAVLATHRGCALHLLRMAPDD